MTKNNHTGKRQGCSLRRQVIGLFLPALACLVELLLWRFLKGLTWILFYPAVFFAGWLGGLSVGLLATAVSLGLGWFFFVPPERTFMKGSLALFLSAMIFTATAILISFLHGRIKKTERELRKAGAEIQSLYEKTLELDKLKTRFFANVSHELRTPLTLILGPVELLLSKQPPSDASAALQTIRRNAHTLLGLVNDLLDVARLEAGKAEVRYAEIDVARLLRRITSSFTSAAEVRGIRLSVEAPDVASSQVDPEKLERIFSNLVSNAFKFAPDGGSVRCALRVSPEQDRVIFEVADSGSGVPVKYRESVFERFFQVDDSSNRRFGGTGLGLAIVKEYVDLHHGSVKVSQAPEGGALFIVKLPAKAPLGTEVQRHRPAPAGIAPLIFPGPVPPPLRRIPPQTTATGPGPGKPVVLVVEDTPDMRDYICEVLGPEFRLETAENGREGLEKAERVSPDLIVSDLMMPEMSGAEMFRKLRASRELAMIPVILVTAKADDELRIELLREGARDYLIKPFIPEELRAKVETLLEVKRLSARAIHAREEAIATVSHDLRNPLTAIQASLLLLKSGSEAGKALVTIERASAQMTSLIQDLLDYAKVEGHRLSLEKKAEDVASIIQEVVDGFEGSAKAKAIELRKEINEGLGTVSCERGRIIRVLSNLVNNAIKFTPSGGRVIVSAVPRDGGALFSVKDTGPGIAPDRLPHVFERYWQAGETARTGTGLGLAIARGFVEAHDGKIWVESKLGVGSTFHFVLPDQAVFSLPMR